MFRAKVSDGFSDRARAVAAGVRCATDVTGFGLFGHLMKLVRVSGVSAVLNAAAIPYLDWVRPHIMASASVGEDELLLLADAQTSGCMITVR